MTDSKMLMKKALGRSAKLGDMYDATVDKFVDRSVFTIPIPEVNTTLDNNSRIDVKMFFSNRFDEKIKICGLDVELAISVISGMTPVSGQAKYFLDNNERRDEVCAALHLNVHKQTRRFNVLDPTLRSFISNDALMNCKQATHVVVGIDFGANETVLLKCSSQTNEDSGQILQDLTAELQHIVSSLPTQQIDDYDDPTPNRSYRRYNLQVYSDIDERQPATIDETISRIQNWIKSDDIGKPCSFILLPLTDLADSLHLSERKVDSEVLPIPDPALQNMLGTFSDLNERKVRFNDLVTMFEKRSEYVSADKKREISFKKAEIEETESKMKYQLYDCVQDVRSKRKSIADLDFVADNLTRCCSMEDLDSLLGDMQNVAHKINFIDDVMDMGVRYVKNFGKSFREIQLQKEFYVFFYMSDESLEDKEEGNLINNMRLFYELAKMQTVPCYFVDRDVDTAKMEGVPNSARICHFRKGTCVSDNYLRAYQEERAFCFVKSKKTMKSVKERPELRIQLKIVCPKSTGNEGCNKVKRFWFCSNCQSHVDYGYDEMFYCDCGRDYAKNFQFLCNDFIHGNEFASFDKEEMKEKLHEIESMPVFNILVLGETGVGKSTWINGIANYLTFSTLKEASNAKEILCLTPTKFSVLENSQEKVIADGSYDNECMEDKEACTQHPRAHLFDVGYSFVRIIDTPGIGDPSSMEQDKENVRNIIRFANNYTEIHGICMLLKPNNAKLNTYIRFCILEMLKHLNKINNFMFCFTNTRSTLYKPGDTYPALKKLLDEINENLKAKSSGNAEPQELSLTENTTYCLDNEAFRFLSARRSVHFSEDDVKNFGSSWSRSVKETTRMLDNIKQTKPQKTIEKVPVNDTRNKILLLLKPMAKISVNITKNIRVAEEQLSHLMALKEKEFKLRENRLITRIFISIEKIVKPQTVCTSEGCVELRTIPGTNEKKTIYKTVCHENCRCSDMNEDVVGADGLRQCSAMIEDQCKICECPWTTHMHITYKFKEKTIRDVDETIEQLIKNKTPNMNIKEQLIATLEENIDGFNEEQDRILDISSKFESFLKVHSILPYKDTFEAHVQHELDIARVDANLSEDETKVETLTKLLEQYAEKNEMLDNNCGSITADHIDSLEIELMNLQLTGESFRSCFEAALASQPYNHSSNKIMQGAVRTYQMHSSSIKAHVQSESFFEKMKKFFIERFWK